MIRLIKTYLKSLIYWKKYRWVSIETPDGGYMQGILSNKEFDELIKALKE
jgi:hypothetical protein